MSNFDDSHPGGLVGTSFELVVCINRLGLYEGAAGLSFDPALSLVAPQQYVNNL